MSEFQLCLLDCRGIQGYVFGSNKLKTNIGASVNVATIFSRTIKNTLGEKFPLDSWLDNPEKIVIFNDEQMPAEVGYIGGGNALLIFRNDGDQSLAEKFVQEWSRRVLLEFPGIVPAAAISQPFSKEENENIPDKILSPLFRQLSVEKNKAVPITTIPRHGITAECSVTGLSAEVFDDDKNVKKWVSSVNMSKTNSAAMLIDREFSELTASESSEESEKANYLFTFTEEKLGQTEAHNHIAIVHIDGNSMGNQFQSCKDLAERRKLSIAVADRTKFAWEATTKKLLNKMKKLTDDKIIAQEKYKKYTLLPLRNIILNGDDLTFTCNAQLAFWLTEELLKTMCAKPLDISGLEKEYYMSACAGIAIVKTKFPFYRAYKLAEELCSNAKIKGREKRESWFDFEIVYGGLSGDLDQIRDKKYSIGTNKLISRPWRVLDDKGNPVSDSNYDWGCLKKATEEFSGTDEHGKSKWPRSKRKELLQRMTRGLESFDDYVLILSARSLELPSKCGTELKGWERLQFYYDTLQAGEFYPKEIL